MTGFGLPPYVREDRRLRKTPFVIITKEHAHALTAARKAGVNARLIKPFPPATLRRTIEEI